MKCPKCGFISFDYPDNCKRCGKELIDLKEKLNVLSVIPRTEGIDELPVELEVEVSEEQEMIDSSDFLVQPLQVELEEKPEVKEVDRGREDEEDLVLEELSEIEMKEPEGSIEEVETHQDNNSSGISIGLEDEVTTETGPQEEDIELSSLEIESPKEEPPSPKKWENEIEAISLDSSDVEVVEFEEEEPSSMKKGSNGEST